MGGWEYRKTLMEIGFRDSKRGGPKEKARQRVGKIPAGRPRYKLGAAAPIEIHW